jgi:hypothetical protein
MVAMLVGCVVMVLIGGLSDASIARYPSLQLKWRGFCMPSFEKK